MIADAWLAQSAAALCRGARWPIALSLGLTVLAAARLLDEPAHEPAAMTAILFAGAAQGYLAMRIELDRVIFERFAADPSAAPAFDAALAQAGWTPQRDGPRAMADRVRGLRRLIALSMAVVMAQLSMFAVAGWARW